MTLDALEQYLSRERSRLLRFISLAGEGDVVFPHIEQNYRAAQLGELPFSVVRAIICCHVLSSSEQLRTLREGLQSSDGGGGDCLVNLVGFCRAVEEAVFNVSNHLNENPALLGINGGEVDQAVSELRLLATESRMTLMNSDSHAMHKKGSTFTLGLLDFLDGVGDEGGEGGEGGGAKLTVDAASIASRRRSSRLSELGGGGGGGIGGLKEKEMPPVVWLSGLFNPSAFLTAVMQTPARRNDWALDRTVVITEVTKKQPEDIQQPSRDGCFVSGLTLEGARWTENGLVRPALTCPRE
jgi:hypothetical protein